MTNLKYEAKDCHRHTIKVRAGLAGVNTVVVVGLSNVDRCAVGLTAGLNGSDVQALRLEVALCINPPDCTRVCKKNFEGGDLWITSQTAVRATPRV